MTQGYWDQIGKKRLSRRQALAALAASGASAAILAACSSDDSGSSSEEPSTGGSSSGGTPQPGGRYATWHITNPNYNPLTNYFEAYGNSGITAYDRPITARGDAKGYNLEAMEKIELAEPTKLVMTLKPGQVYHNKAPVNGRKVLASDIIATQNHIKALANAYDSAFQRTFLDRMEAPNDTTVIFYLKQPSAYLFSSAYLANPTSQLIVPAEILDKLDSTPAIGSGPYELADHIFAQTYNYKKFENFREAKKGMPYITERVSLAINDPVAQETAFRGGQLSEFTPATAVVERLLGELDKTKFSHAQYLNSFMTGTAANMNASLGGPRPWHDIRVREAIYKLTNKQQWVDLAYRGRGVTNPGPLPANLESYQLDPKFGESYYKEDLQKANQLLSAANYDKNSEWEILCSSAFNANLAEIWQQQLTRGGFKVRASVLPIAEILQQRQVPGKFDLRVGTAPGSDAPGRVLRYNHSTTNEQYSNIGLYNKEIDALIEKSEVALDKKENVKLVEEVQKKILEQYTMTFYTCTDFRTSFYDSRLQDYWIDPLYGQSYQYQAWLKA